MKESYWIHETTGHATTSCEATQYANFGGTSAESMGGVTMTTHYISKSIVHMCRARQVITSKWTNFKMHFQELRRLKRKCVIDRSLDLDYAYKIFSWSCFELRELRQLNTSPSPTTKCNLKLLNKRYGQIHTTRLPWLHLSCLHISHKLWTPHGEDLFTNNILPMYCVLQSLIPIDWI